jgi:hypothetical protein
MITNDSTKADVAMPHTPVASKQEVTFSCLTCCIDALLAAAGYARKLRSRLSAPATVLSCIHFLYPSLPLLLLPLLFFPLLLLTHSSGREQRQQQQ